MLGAKMTVEKWDLYDCDGVKKNRTIVRGEKLQEGDYHLVVHIWIRNSRGEHLIQKRAAHLKSNPDIWAFTGGAVVTGEESLTAAIRETQEELGLLFHESDLNHIHTITRIDSIVHVWSIITNLEVHNIPFNTDEVAEVAWRTSEQIKEMLDAGNFYVYHDSYLQLALSK